MNPNTYTPEAAKFAMQSAFDKIMQLFEKQKDKTNGFNISSNMFMCGQDMIFRITFGKNNPSNKGE